jgi:hypothetical protein
MSENLCDACGHEHQGPALAHICIGCACPERPAPASAPEQKPELTTLCTWGEGLCACPECSRNDGAEEERNEVLAFLRRHDADQVLGITPPPLADLIAQLERGEHRR